MGVKRFDFIQDHERRDGWIEEAALGQYVLANDYDAIAAELAALKRTREQEQDYANTCYRNQQLEAAAEKVHGIIAEYWGPCMGSVESLLTLREAVGERATTWLPKVSDLPRVTSLETEGE